jgi:hypothetical protein
VDWLVSEGESVTAFKKTKLACVSGHDRVAGQEAGVMASPRRLGLISWTFARMRPYRGRMAFLVGIAFTQIVLGLLSPWPLKIVVDNVLGGEPLPSYLAEPIRAVSADSRVGSLVVIVAAGLLLQLVSQVVSMANTQVQVDTGQRMVYSLRAKLLVSATP